MSEREIEYIKELNDYVDKRIYGKKDCVLNSRRFAIKGNFYNLLEYYKSDYD